MELKSEGSGAIPSKELSKSHVRCSPNIIPSPLFILNSYSPMKGKICATFLKKISKGLMMQINFLTAFRDHIYLEYANF